jgi:hypothetical protein
VSHPSLGLPPPDDTAGRPDAARRVLESRARLGARALAIALDADPTLRERNDETGLRARLHDAELLAERLSVALGTGDPMPMREYADWTGPVYRRKKVPLGDLMNLCEGLRQALPDVLAPGELPEAGVALDEAIAVYKWHRRIAGDARKKNAFLQFLYKGG